METPTPEHEEKMTRGLFDLSERSSAVFEKRLGIKLHPREKRRHQLTCILIHCHFNISKNHQPAAVIVKLVSESITNNRLTDGKL